MRWSIYKFELARRVKNILRTTQCCILLLRVYAKYMLQETIRFMSQAKVSTQAGSVTKKEPISDT